MDFTEKELHRLQANLRELINVAPQLRDHLCNTGQLDARDKVSLAGGHLMIAEGIIGQLSFAAPDGSVIKTAEGGGGGGGK
jgi:hypothetical protein